MTEYPFDHDDDSAIGDALRHARFVKCGIYDAPEWYDVDYAGYRGEEAFYRLVLQRHCRADGMIVELGAGTGRLALKFAADGHRVHGVEPAAPMRALLERKRAQAALARLSVADGRASTFVPPRGRIDVVIFPFNGLLHIQTRAEVIASFRHVHGVLDDGGRFALDCTGPYWDAILYGPMPWGRSDVRVHPEHGRTVLTCDRSSYDASTRQMCIDIRYVLEGDDEGTEITLRQTMWTWQEVLSALNESGFVVDTIHGDVDLAPFDEGSPRLLVNARKR